MNFALCCFFCRCSCRTLRVCFFCHQLHMLESLYEAVQAESCRQIVDVSVCKLSESSAFWAGDGRCVEATVSQPLKTSFTVDVITGKLLWFLENVKTERTSHLFLQHLLYVAFCHESFTIGPDLNQPVMSMFAHAYRKFNAYYGKSRLVNG